MDGCPKGFTIPNSITVAILNATYCTIQAYGCRDPSKIETGSGVEFKAQQTRIFVAKTSKY
ncbi:hypothetical protein GCM10009096_33940 [Parasphingorhabdus litoris]|uniref:Uncharacterized protein n=1 Tax=Parasphingorhabdus litoris TaxID=394733 RepID=A0ABN1B1R9_9SPHN